MSRARNTTCWVSVLTVAATYAILSGQQPNRKPEPWAAPYLPAEPAWSQTLPAEPAAPGAMDVDRVYIPMKASVAREIDAAPSSPPAIIALNRETGATAWTSPVESRWPPVVDGAVVYVASEKAVHALDASSGRESWSVAIEHAPDGPMLVRGNVLVAVTQPSELVGIRTDTRTVAWRRAIADSTTVKMTADDRAVYAATSTGRLLRVMLADGTVDWDESLYQGELGEPAIARDRVLVGTAGAGTGPRSRSFFARDADDGSHRWSYDFRHLGGHPVGAAADDDVVYVAVLDNILRAFNRGNGNQKWKRDIGARPIFPPVVHGNTVIVTGINPMLSAFHARKDGAPAGTWSAPPNAEPQGKPLIDPQMRPFRTAIVVLLRDGQVTALRPTAMLFKEAAPVPLTLLPGRPLQVERLPGHQP